MYELATWLFLGGVVGARGLYVLLHPEVIHTVGDIFRSWQGGNVFYGCILGGLAGSLLYWCRRPYPLWTMIDVAAPAVAIGAAVGRIGCFLNGCCDGVVCTLPWGVQFPAGSHAWMRQMNAGLISEEIALVATRASDPDLRRRGRLGRARCTAGLLPLAPPPGEVMALLMITYSMTRLPIEALRADERVVFFAGMNSAQVISVVLLVIGLAAWLCLRFANLRAVDRAGALKTILHESLTPTATEPVSAGPG